MIDLYKHNVPIKEKRLRYRNKDVILEKVCNLVTKEVVGYNMRIRDRDSEGRLIAITNFIDYGMLIKSYKRFFEYSLLELASFKGE